MWYIIILISFVAHIESLFFQDVWIELFKIKFENSLRENMLFASNIRRDKSNTRWHRELPHRYPPSDARDPNFVNRRRADEYRQISRPREE